MKAFEERVNSHLVGKWVNIASRCAGFIHKFFNGKLAKSLGEEEISLLSHASKRRGEIESNLAGREFARATTAIADLADHANAIIQRRAPWVVAKQQQMDELHQICSLALNFFRVLAIFLKPIIPTTVAKVEQFLRVKPFVSFAEADAVLLDHQISEYSPLMVRIETKQIDAMIEASKENLQPSTAPAAPVAPAPAPSAATPTISIDDFAKMDLRVGKVLECGFVDGSDKLLRFVLDAGELGRRQIFSGIRAAYQEPEKLVGRKVVFIANLAPRKMRFGVSEGMILSAGSGGSDLHLLDADAGATAGMPVK
jgi:methionyl-tRNA synthetase